MQCLCRLRFDGISGLHRPQNYKKYIAERCDTAGVVLTVLKFWSVSDSELVRSGHRGDKTLGRGPLPFTAHSIAHRTAVYSCSDLQP